MRGVLNPLGRGRKSRAKEPRRCSCWGTEGSALDVPRRGRFAQAFALSRIRTSAKNMDDLIPAHTYKDRDKKRRFRRNSFPAPCMYNGVPRTKRENGDQRRARKKPRSKAADSSASKPPCTWMRWLWRSEIKVSKTLPAAPVLGSVAAYTTRATRACTNAIAHIAHGSKVTYKVESGMRWLRTRWPASRNVPISAW